MAPDLGSISPARCFVLRCGGGLAGAEGTIPGPAVGGSQVCELGAETCSERSSYGHRQNRRSGMR